MSHNPSPQRPDPDDYAVYVCSKCGVISCVNVPHTCLPKWVRKAIKDRAGRSKDGRRKST